MANVFVTVATVSSEGSPGSNRQVIPPPKTINPLPLSASRNSQLDIRVCSDVSTIHLLIGAFKER